MTDITGLGLLVGSPVARSRRGHRPAEWVAGWTGSGSRFSHSHDWRVVAIQRSGSAAAFRGGAAARELRAGDRGWRHYEPGARRLAVTKRIASAKQLATVSGANACAYLAAITERHRQQRFAVAAKRLSVRMRRAAGRPAAAPILLSSAHSTWLGSALAEYIR